MYLSSCNFIKILLKLQSFILIGTQVLYTEGKLYKVLAAFISIMSFNLIFKRTAWGFTYFMNLIVIRFMNRLK